MAGSGSGSRHPARWPIPPSSSRPGHAWRLETWDVKNNFVLSTKHIERHRAAMLAQGNSGNSGTEPELFQGDHVEADRARQSPLPLVERQERGRTELDGAGDMQHVQCPAAELGCVVATEVAGSAQSRTPRHIRLHVPARRKILFERAQGVTQCVRADVAAECRETDAVHHLRARMRRNRERTARARAPGVHRPRLGLVQIELQQRGRVDVDRFSARHDCLRAVPLRPADSSGEADAVSCGRCSPSLAAPWPPSRTNKASACSESFPARSKGLRPRSRGFCAPSETGCASLERSRWPPCETRSYHSGPYGSPASEIGLRPRIISY